MRYSALRLAYQLATPGRTATARSSRVMPRSGSLVWAAIMPSRASAAALSGAVASTSLQMPAASPKRLAWAAVWARARAWSGVSVAAVRRFRSCGRVAGGTASPRSPSAARHRAPARHHQRRTVFGVPDARREAHKRDRPGGADEVGAIVSAKSSAAWLAVGRCRAAWQLPWPAVRRPGTRAQSSTSTTWCMTGSPVGEHAAFARRKLAP